MFGIYLKHVYKMEWLAYAFMYYPFLGGEITKFTLLVTFRFTLSLSIAIMLLNISLDYILPLRIKFYIL